MSTNKQPTAPAATEKAKDEKPKGTLVKMLRNVSHQQRRPDVIEEARAEAKKRNVPHGDVIQEMREDGKLGEKLELEAGKRYWLSPKVLAEIPKDCYELVEIVRE